MSAGSPHNKTKVPLSIIRQRELVLKALLYGCTLFSLLVTVAILTLLATELVQFVCLDEVRISDFLFGTEWSPLRGDHRFGVAPLLCGTILVSLIGMVLALPMGLVMAIYLNEFASPGFRARVRPAIESLAGIPTVVYGFFALTFVAPSLMRLHEGFDFYNATSAGLAIGILCLPTVVSLVEDALRSVPTGIRESAYALGATPYEVATRAIVPAAKNGIISSCLLVLARAVGETMIVALAAGSRARLTVDPRQEVQTLTGFIAQVAKGDVHNFGIEYYSIYAVAAFLFLLTTTLTVIGYQIRKRGHEAYA